jgi:hypothetical protein
MATQLAITIPQGYGPGQTLVVQAPDGQQMQVKIPPGMKAGQQLRIAIPPAAAQPEKRASKAADTGGIELQNSREMLDTLVKKLEARGAAR